jgi:DNA-binding SARP family transcriptional activator
VQLFDGFRLEQGGRQRQLAPTAARLVAYLALNDTGLTRSQVAGTLWADRREDRAAASLRSAIWRVNSGEHTPLVHAERSTLRLCPHRLDARTAESAAHDQLVGGPAIDPRALSGLLLPGWDEDWVVVERERLRLLCLAGLEQMAAALLNAGELYRAIEAACAVIAVEPLQESAYRVFVEAHARLGNRAEAVRQYELCRAVLHRDLGLDPSPDLTERANQLRVGSHSVGAGPLPQAPVLRR